MNLTNKSEEELFIWWKNCRAYLENPEKAKFHDKAKQRITDIKCEWDRRMKEAEEGDYNTTRPNKGMMARLGYHVGTTGGATPSARRRIIDLVMTEQLPFFHSPMYVREWGEPNTADRYQKLERFFQGMLNGRYAGDMDQAMNEWTKDLEYLEQTYGDI